MIETKAEERFWSKVDRSGPTNCWPWLASRHHTGYGQIAIDRSKRLAHRIAYELMVGPIPPGLVIDHLCRVRHCVNPAHMEPVTPRENTDRGLRSSTKTHCVHGHEFTPENTSWSGTERHCRACWRVRSAKYREQKRARLEGDQ